MASTFKNAIAANIGTSPTDLYTVPAATSSTVIGLSLANNTTSLIYATVTLTKGATTLNVIKNGPIPVGGSLILFGGDQKLVMMATDKISVTSSDATSVDAILSFLEIA